MGRITKIGRLLADGDDLLRSAAGRRPRQHPHLRVHRRAELKLGILRLQALEGGALLWNKNVGVDGAHIDSVIEQQLRKPQRTRRRRVVYRNGSLSEKPRGGRYRPFSLRFEQPRVDHRDIKTIGERLKVRPDLRVIIAQRQIEIIDIGPFFQIARRGKRWRHIGDVEPAVRHLQILAEGAAARDIAYLKAGAAQHTHKIRRILRRIIIADDVDTLFIAYILP